MDVKRNLFWNTIGTIFYLAAQWLTTVLIVRLTGNYEDAGLYSLAMSVSNVFYMVAIYNVRNFQVSDIEEQFTNEDYVFHRLFVMSIAFVSCLLFALVSYTDWYTIGILVSYMVFRLGESFVDVLHGIDQRLDRLDIVGKSYMMRGAILLAVFFVGEKVTGNLLITILFMAISTFLFIYFYDFRHTNRLVVMKKKVNATKIKGLLLLCFPLLVYGILLNLIAAIPRFITEKLLGKELLGYYASVATPAVIVQSFASVIFAPFVTTFTRYYQEKEKERFRKLAISMLIFCALLGVVSYFGSLLLGEFILDKVIYPGKGIRPYCYLLNTTMICTTMVAVIWFLAILLTIDRANLLLSVATFAGVLAVAVFGTILISQYGLVGINWSLMCSYLTVCLIMGIGLIVRMKRHFKEGEN